MDNTISSNTLRINLNAREYDYFLPSGSTVSNSESFNSITLDTELPEASGSETSSDDENCFASTKTADNNLFTFLTSSTSTKIRSYKRSLLVSHYDHGFL